MENCLTCGKKNKSAKQKFCSRRCLYESPIWRESQRQSRTNYRVDKLVVCPGCHSEFAPCNHRQRICNVCKENSSSKTVTRLLRYGIKKELLDELESQKCELCDRKAKFVDHDHKTGKTRGFLCPACNSALSSAEIPGWIENVQLYLAKYNKM